MPQIGGWQASEADGRGDRGFSSGPAAGLVDNPGQYTTVSLCLLSVTRREFLQHTRH